MSRQPRMIRQLAIGPESVASVVTFADIDFTAVSLVSFFVGHVSRWAR